MRIVAAHDLEELLAVDRWSEGATARLAERHPLLGRVLARVLPISRREMAVGVGIVAAGAGGVTAASLRNLNGDLRLFQAALAAFLSAFAEPRRHVDSLPRLHTGRRDRALVIVPYSLRAWPRPRRAGVGATPAEAFRPARTGFGLALSVSVLGHVLARAMARRRVDYDFRWIRRRTAH